MNSFSSKNGQAFILPFLKLKDKRNTLNQGQCRSVSNVNESVWGDSKIPAADERLSKTVLGRVYKELFRKKIRSLETKHGET